MSDVLPDTPSPLSVHETIQIRLAVIVARLLSHQSPRRIKTILTFVSRRSRPASYAEAKSARDAVLTASARCRGRTACLVRSLSVVLLCRGRGVWPTWCVGVLVTPPFAAHAWIEADGDVVDEPLRRHELRPFFMVPSPNPRPARAGQPRAHEAPQP